MTQDSDQNNDSFRNTRTSITDNQHWDEALDLSSDGEQSLDTDDGLGRRPNKKNPKQLHPWDSLTRFGTSGVRQRSQPLSPPRTE